MYNITLYYANTFSIKLISKICSYVLVCIPVCMYVCMYCMYTSENIIHTNLERTASARLDPFTRLVGGMVAAVWDFIITKSNVVVVTSVPNINNGQPQQEQQEQPAPPLQPQQRPDPNILL